MISEVQNFLFFHREGGHGGRIQKSYARTDPNYTQFEKYVHTVFFFKPTLSYAPQLLKET